MRIFMSHSSNQKLFVRELVRSCPKSINFWIDEKDILLGENIESRITQAINGDCEYFILILDANAAQSEWVQKEIKLALNVEKQRNSVFLLPVVLDRKAWTIVSPLVDQNRKYISCFDLSEESIRAASSKLVTEIFNWLIEKNSVSSEASASDNSIELQLKKAEDTYKTLASQFKQVIYPHRRNNPIDLKGLRANMARIFDASFNSETEVSNALNDLINKGYLPSYFFDGELAFLANERFSQKTGVGAKAKILLAKKAARLIHDDMNICIDGGSTTFLLSKELGKLIVAGVITGLNVFTNSIPVAHELLSSLNKIHLNDRDTTCVVYLMGGWCRPSSMCTVVRGAATQELKTDQMFSEVDKHIDISFMGTSGIYANHGFGITHEFEIPAKKAMFEVAQDVVILADSMKFRIPQPTLFAPFCEKIHVISDVDKIEIENIATRDAIESTGVRWTQCDE